MKQAFLIVLAVGLLVGGSAALALAQSSPNMGGPILSGCEWEIRSIAGALRHWY